MYFDLTKEARGITHLSGLLFVIAKEFQSTQFWCVRCNVLLLCVAIVLFKNSSYFHTHTSEKQALDIFSQVLTVFMTKLP